jgi:hypothetical protein
MHQDLLHLYAIVNAHNTLRWPYPPGYLPWLELSGAVSSQHFRFLIHVPPILADGAIAWLVADLLRLRGAEPWTRLAACGLVALGPSFIAISGYHGQIDSLAILPALAAMRVWLYGNPRTRALLAGLLIGAGTTLKKPPVFLLLALLPVARSWRERATLTASTALIPLALTAPFLVATPHATFHSLTYRGLPGAGGISLLVQPDAARTLLRQVVPRLNSVDLWLFYHGGLLTLATLAAVAVLLWRARGDELHAAVLVWLTVYVFGINLFLEYLPWGLPFFLAAGYVKRTAQLQVALVIPTLIVYGGPWSTDRVLFAYIPLMMAVWLAILTALIVQVPRVARRDRETAPAVAMAS